MVQEKTIHGAALTLAVGAGVAALYFVVDQIAHGRVAYALVFALLLAYMLMVVRVTWRAWASGIRVPSEQPLVMRAMGWSIIAVIFLILAI
ncbi:hypothetical protein [Longimicrobium terrae]|uniref:Uncharacterized protein n=1 Tax=Longimicrobium terrae TaxID=1639882 RepID=A0A841GSQ9_9BACT|nr:hypothetical protein [Longimicrobium terrae]MBB4635944.1 hypothetical protein [Longimicrobium terrae]MBB6070340.1 hypothetical protein [Longimicrobium terrae]NNC30839.1 hypothetical protein [Longimicrobium terrae]